MNACPTRITGYHWIWVAACLSCNQPIWLPGVQLGAAAGEARRRSPFGGALHRPLRSYQFDLIGRNHSNCHRMQDQINRHRQIYDLRRDFGVPPLRTWQPIMRGLRMLAPVLGLQLIFPHCSIRKGDIEVLSWFISMQPKNQELEGSECLKPQANPMANLWGSMFPWVSQFIHSASIPFMLIVDGYPL